MTNFTRTEAVEFIQGFNRWERRESYNFEFDREGLAVKSPVSARLRIVPIQNFGSLTTCSNR